MQPWPPSCGGCGAPTYTLPMCTRCEEIEELQHIHSTGRELRGWVRRRLERSGRVGWALRYADGPYRSYFLTDLGIEWLARNTSPQLNATAFKPDDPANPWPGVRVVVNPNHTGPPILIDTKAWTGVQCGARSVKALARRAAEVNAANGWQPACWDTVPIKLGAAMVECGEVVAAMQSGHRPDVHEEIADVCIYLLSSLHDMHGDGWCSRVEHRQPTAGHAFASPHEIVAPVRVHLEKGFDAWRKGKEADVQQRMELAVLEAYRLSDRLGFDLGEAIAAKVEVNAGRPRLHGKAQALG